MNAMRLSFAALAVCLLGLAAQADEKKTDYAKMVVGKWEITKSFNEGPPVGAHAEMTKDGKLHVQFKMGDDEVKIEGTYKVEGDKVSYVMKAGTDEHKATFTIKKISKTEMTTEDDKGNIVELKRVK
jgi:uncharacterized protein (TIGR03066 family)